MMYLQVAGGLIVLLIGGEILVRGAVSLAEQLGVTKLVIGLTVVAFGTSLPELVVCVQAALDGHPGIAVGNVVGSNIANILLVLGLPALFFPLFCDSPGARRDGTAMIIATLLFMLLCWFGLISRIQGALLVAMLLGYMYYSYQRAQRCGDELAEAMADEFESTAAIPRSSILSGLFVAVGLVALFFGSNLLIDGAVGIAKAVGLSDVVIGVTLVALGTSLPELAAAIVAALHRHGDVAVGNVVGSNLFNILGITGSTALITDVAVPEQIMRFDIWVMLLAALVVMPFILRHRPIGRFAGLFFVAAYGAYIVAQFNGISSITHTAGL